MSRFEWIVFVAPLVVTAAFRLTIESLNPFATSPSSDETHTLEALGQRKEKGPATTGFLARVPGAQLFGLADSDHAGKLHEHNAEIAANLVATHISHQSLAESTVSGMNVDGLTDIGSYAHPEVQTFNVTFKDAGVEKVICVPSDTWRGPFLALPHKCGQNGGYQQLFFVTIPSKAKGSQVTGALQTMDGGCLVKAVAGPGSGYSQHYEYDQGEPSHLQMEEIAESRCAGTVLEKHFLSFIDFWTVEEGTTWKRKKSYDKDDQKCLTFTRHANFIPSSTGSSLSAGGGMYLDVSGVKAGGLTPIYLYPSKTCKESHPEEWTITEIGVSVKDPFMGMLGRFKVDGPSVKSTISYEDALNQFHMHLNGHESSHMHAIMCVGLPSNWNEAYKKAKHKPLIRLSDGDCEFNNSAARVWFDRNSGKLRAYHPLDLKIACAAYGDRDIWYDWEKKRGTMQRLIFTNNTDVCINFTVVDDDGKPLLDPDGKTSVNGRGTLVEKDKHFNVLTYENIHGLEEGNTAAVYLLVPRGKWAALNFTDWRAKLTSYFTSNCLAGPEGCGKRRTGV